MFERSQVPGRATAGRASPGGARQAPGGLLHLQRTAGNRAATAFVQRDWLSDVWDRGLFDGSMLAQADPGLPRSLITHYMRATGADYTLTGAEMIEVDASTNVFSWYPVIRTERNRLLAQATADPSPTGTYTATIAGARGRGAAGKNQTLGNFTITLHGTLTVTKGSIGALAEFVGTATYYDYWDFDPKAWDTFVTGTSGRSTTGEAKTWVGAAMEGAPFHIRSGATVDVRQHQFDSWAAIT